MDLTWLAAVLRPRDVAIHPDFDGDERNNLAPAFLAAVVLGDGWRLRRLVDINNLSSGVEPPDPAITYVSNTFKAETEEQGLMELSRILLNIEPDDAARSCALTLLASCSAAAVDDYDICDKLLDDQLSWTANSDLPDDHLLQAALLQQKSLRFRDSGRPYREISAAALRLLIDLDVTRCSEFTLSRSVSWSSTETLRQIVSTLRDSAYSLLSNPLEEPFNSDDLILPGQEQLRSREIDYLLDSDQTASQQYSDFVRDLFRQRFFGTDITSTGRPEVLPLFYVTLALELAGHGRVYSSRREQAELQCSQAVLFDNHAEFESILRLFRRAASKRDVDLLLSWLRASGPLEALAGDARRVMRFRSLPTLLRSIELRVLAAAAEVLTQEEADTALDAVLISISRGGPPDLPGERELQVIRLESAWRAAAALANTSGRTDEIARRLLAESGEISGDQLRDRSVATAVSAIEWDNVSSDVKKSWREYLSANRDSAPIVTSVIAPVLGKSLMSANPQQPDLDVIATWLNISFRGNVIDPHILDAAVPQVRNAMAEIRSSAARHTFTLGAPTGDIAAALIVHAGVVELWSDLVGFLKDPAVPRLDRSPAFERLARYAREVPSEARAELEPAIDSILESSDEIFGAGITPYPEAVRFYGAAGLVADIKLLDLTARLAGQGDKGRREAAKTLAILSRTSSNAWMFGFSTELSYNGNADTRAFAARSLTQLATSSSEIASLAERRLMDLLKEDGLLTPLEVLRGLKEFNFHYSDDSRALIEWIRDNHPSRAIRRGARDVLNVESRQSK